MRFPSVVALLGAVAVLGAAGCGGGSARGAAADAAGSTAPAASAGPTGTATPSGAPRSPAPVPATLRFTATTLSGQPFRAATLAGRPVVLWFWAPWCATCAGQAPSVAELAQEYGGKVAVVGVPGMGEVAAMRDFVKEFELGAVPQLNDQDGAVWRRFEVTEQSTYVLLDRDGRIVHRGWLDSQQFAERVAALAR